MTASRLRRAAGEFGVADIPAWQFQSDQGQHAGELAEQQDAPPFLRVGSSAVPRRRVPDALGRGQTSAARIATDLAQFQQRVEDGDMVAAHALRGRSLSRTRFPSSTTNTRTAPIAPRRARRCARSQSSVAVRWHVFLARGAVRSAPPAAPSRCWRAPCPAARSDVRQWRVNRLLIAEEARQQKVEQRPQLAEVVLHRRAGQAQAMTRIELTHHLGGLGARILDGLRLVQINRWKCSCNNRWRSRGSSG